MFRRRMPAIGIGPPIPERTGGPPHRSGRADFPHPAPRTCGFATRRQPPARTLGSSSWVAASPVPLSARVWWICQRVLSPGHSSLERVHISGASPPSAGSLGTVTRLHRYYGGTLSLHEPPTISLPRRRVAHGEQLVGLHRFLGDPVPGLPHSSTPAEPVCPIHGGHWVLLSRLGFPPGVRPLRQPQH